jgi:hypothetical protein
VILDDDGDVVHRLLHPAGQLVEGVRHERLKSTAGAVRHRL